MVAQVEGQVAARPQPAVDEPLGEVVDSDVQVLDDAREDEAAEVRLVDVDTDPEDASPLRRLECAETAGPRDVEHDRRAVVDLLTCGVRAGRRGEEGAAICPQEPDFGVGALRPCLEARDVRLHGRDRDTTDRADDVGRWAPVGHPGRDETSQIRSLLRMEDGPYEVRRRGLGARRRESDVPARRVEGGELLVREPVRGLS